MRQLGLRLTFCSRSVGLALTTPLITTIGNRENPQIVCLQIHAILYLRDFQCVFRKVWPKPITSLYRASIKSLTLREQFCVLSAQSAREPVTRQFPVPLSLASRADKARTQRTPELPDGQARMWGDSSTVERRRISIRTQWRKIRRFDSGSPYQVGRSSSVERGNSRRPEMSVKPDRPIEINQRRKMTKLTIRECEVKDE